MVKRNTRLRALASQLQAEPTAELSTSSPVRPQPAALAWISGSMIASGSDDPRDRRFATTR